MLKIEDLSLSFGSKTAVDQVSLTVPEGQVLAVLGPSGCGKSSLLRMIAGLQAPDSGQIYWQGENIAECPVHERGFGLMFQEGQLFPNRSVAGNVAYPQQIKQAWWKKWKKPELSQVKELLNLVGLPDYADRRIDTLSGGQAQRVALARCLAMNPKLLLLDEPLSALDRSWRESLVQELRQIIKQKQITALYVTHDQAEAFAIADQIAIMQRGKLLSCQTTKKLCANPGSIEVAKFLGYGPFLSASQAAYWGIRIPENQVLALAPGAFRVVTKTSHPLSQTDIGKTATDQAKTTQAVTGQVNNVQPTSGQIDIGQFSPAVWVKVEEEQISQQAIGYRFMLPDVESESKISAIAQYRIGNGNTWDQAPTEEKILVSLDSLLTYPLSSRP